MSGLLVWTVRNGIIALKLYSRVTFSGSYLGLTLINLGKTDLQSIFLINIRCFIYFWKGEFSLNMFGYFLFIYLATFLWGTFPWHIETSQYNDKYINGKTWSQVLTGSVDLSPSVLHKGLPKQSASNKFQAFPRQGFGERICIKSKTKDISGLCWSFCSQSFVHGYTNNCETKINT